MTGSVEHRAGSVGEGFVPASSVRDRSSRATPDFFLVGHPKSGTTALYEMLRRHPQIYMPELKEPSFLAPDQSRRFQRAGSGPLPGTLEEYLALFEAARPGQRVGEASSAYLMSQAAPARIAELQPDARIVAILREPASLLRSLHLQLLQDHVETERSLRRAISLESARREGRHIPPRSPRPEALQYSERVRFAEQLRRYHGVFGRERVLVLLYDDFRRENEATVRRVLRFLGVDDDGVDVVGVEANPTVRVRSQRLDRLVHSVSVGRGPVGRLVKGPVMALAPRRVRRGVLGAVRTRVVLASPPAVDHDLMLELRRRYLPEVLAVSEYLDRDLVSLWGYDRLG
ncbi:MAG: sulfotransferase [Solirubrobacteraceae bacterium]